MISRVILLVVLGVIGLRNLYPAEPEPVAPLTSAQLRAKGLAASKSEACKEKKKSEKLKELCKRWEKHDA